MFNFLIYTTMALSIDGASTDMVKKVRLDQQLVDLGLVGSLVEARSVIMAGKVLVAEQKLTKSGQLVDPTAKVRIKGQSRFVSRGGEKLWGAIQDFSLQELVKNAVILDVGSSTGGFTDCCLQLGARKVYAVDVGTNQLAWRLREDPRVIAYEKTDIRDFENIIDPEISFVVADISFNSLDRLLPHILNRVPRFGVKYLLLIKPQFELAAEQVPDGGVVDSQESRNEALEIVKRRIDALGLEWLGFHDSKIKGRSGNQEVFVLAQSQDRME